MSLTVAIALVWKNGELLVARRRAGSHLAFKLEFPGGKVKSGETAAQAAEREVLEETGVVCRARAERAPIEYRYPERTVTLIPVDADWQSGEAEPLEADDPRWVAPGELRAEDFPDANAELIKELRARATPALPGASSGG